MLSFGSLNSSVISYQAQNFIGKGLLASIAEMNENVERGIADFSCYRRRFFGFCANLLHISFLSGRIYAPSRIKLRFAAIRYKHLTPPETEPTNALTAGIY